MHTRDVPARGGALAGRTGDVIGCGRDEVVQAGAAEQVAAGEAVDGRRGRRVRRDGAGTRRARARVWQKKRDRKKM